MGSDAFDVVIIGGGIHGVGIAQAAAAHGYSALVLEQQALAAGTSSRSSKLIHGGLRYLETGQLRLVRECLRERALLLQLAPELVRLVPFHIPVYRDTRRGALRIRMGLSLYAVLGGLGAQHRFRRLPHSAWDTLDGLDTHGLRAVFQYRDAQTDDAALTRAVMHSACELGARLEVPARFVRALRERGGWAVHYRKDGVDCRCAATVLINAAGPWVNAVLEAITPHPHPPAVELVQGAHVVIAGTLTRGMYYLEAPQDGRAVFAMPWRGNILVGTTETPFNGDPAQVTVHAQEQSYLLEAFARYFPEYRKPGALRMLDAYAGLRVLAADARSPFARARDTRLIVDRDDRPTLLSLYGGKLTAYRATSEAVVRRIAASLPHREPRADTRSLRLHPAPD